MGESNPVRVKELGICPGWLVRQQAVREAGLAGLAMSKGELEVFFPEPSNALIDAAALMTSAWNGYEAEQTRKMKQRG